MWNPVWLVNEYIRLEFKTPKSIKNRGEKKPVKSYQNAINEKEIYIEDET